MVFIIKTVKDPIYFEKYLSTSENEYVFIKFYKNNKIKFFNSINKIKIKKIISQYSYEGKHILYNFGYNMQEYDKIIFKCVYLKKSKFFNKKIGDVMFIIINYNGGMILYKYDFRNNKCVYNTTLIENKEKII